MSSDWSELESEVESPPDEAMAARRLGDRLYRIGGTMLACCFAVLLLGRMLVLLLLPNWVGQGWTPLTLAILIPVWSIGGVGLVLLLVGAVMRWRGKRMRERKS